LTQNSVLSIVIVTKDNLEDLFLTLNSLHGLESAEVVIVNGSEVAFSPKIQSDLERRGCKIIAGPDSGIYDGMNKGLSLSNGDFIWFLNSGDQSAVNVLSDGFLHFLESTSADWIVGLQEPALAFPRTALRFSKTLLSAGLRPIPHQSTLIRRRHLQEFGGFSLSHPIVADQELFLRLFAKGLNPYMFSTTLSVRKIGGIGDLQTKGSFKSQVRNIRALNGIEYSFAERIYEKIITISYCGIRRIHNFSKWKLK